MYKNLTVSEFLAFFCAEDIQIRLINLDNKKTVLESSFSDINFSETHGLGVYRFKDLSSGKEKKITLDDLLFEGFDIETIRDEGNIITRLVIYCYNGGEI